MRRLLSTICAVAIAATMGAVPAASAGALPIPQLATPDAVPLAKAGHRSYNDDVFERRGQYGGHRHYYKHRHPHGKYRYRHRHRDGDWIVPFIGGAIIGGILSEATRPRVRSYRGDPHVAWCYRRYRSYREWDNTFQPYHGPRKQCISPYY